MDKKITVELTVAQWNIVGVGLGELPLKISGAVNEEIAIQISQKFNEHASAEKTELVGD